MTFEQYLWHFDPEYLFISGGKNSRLSSEVAGEFLGIDALFLILGLGYLLYKRSKAGLVVLGWALIGPLPSSMFGEAPHPARAFLMMGSWQIVSALGFYSLINLFKKILWKWTVSAVCLVVLFILLIPFLRDYFNEFPKSILIKKGYIIRTLII